MPGHCLYSAYTRQFKGNIAFRPGVHGGGYHCHYTASGGKVCFQVPQRVAVEWISTWFVNAPQSECETCTDTNAGVYDIGSEFGIPSR